MTVILGKPLQRWNNSVERVTVTNQFVCKIRRPKLKWVSCHDGQLPSHAVPGGTQNGVRLYVIRAPYMGSVTPGKLYEYCPPGGSPDIPKASLSWGGAERFRTNYEVV